MKVLGGVLILACALLLSGCAVGGDPVAASPGVELVVSTVPSDSVPGFLSEPQDEFDVVDEFDVAATGVDPASIRFQGEWGGREIFLGVSGKTTVNLIVGIDGDPGEWGTGRSIGNAVIGTNPDWTSKSGETTLQYVPQGTEEVPEGWSALSEWIIVRG